MVEDRGPSRGRHEHPVFVRGRVYSRIPSVDPSRAARRASPRHQSVKSHVPVPRLGEKGSPESPLQAPAHLPLRIARRVRTRAYVPEGVVVAPSDERFAGMILRILTISSRLVRVHRRSETERSRVVVRGGADADDRESVPSRERVPRSPLSVKGRDDVHRERFGESKHRDVVREEPSDVVLGMDGDPARAQSHAVGPERRTVRAHARVRKARPVLDQTVRGRRADGRGYQRAPAHGGSGVVGKVDVKRTEKGTRDASIDVPNITRGDGRR